MLEGLYLYQGQKEIQRFTNSISMTYKQKYIGFAPPISVLTV